MSKPMFLSVELTGAGWRARLSGPPAYTDREHLLEHTGVDAYGAMREAQTWARTHGIAPGALQWNATGPNRYSTPVTGR